MYHQTENQLGNVRPKFHVVFSGSKRWAPRDVSAGLGRGVHLGVSLCRVKAAGWQRKRLQLQWGAQPILWGALEPGWALRSPLHQGGRAAGMHSPMHRPAFVCGPPTQQGAWHGGGSHFFQLRAVPGWSLSSRAVRPTHLVAREIVVLARVSARLQSTLGVTVMQTFTEVGRTIQGAYTSNAYMISTKRNY